MDEYSFYVANLLLDNNYNTNILEINFPNISLLVHEKTTIAITGAKCDFFINDEKKETWQAWQVFKGDIIKISNFTNGLRAYLSIKGGFNVKKEVYGLDLDKIKKGDILKFNLSQQTPYKKRLKKSLIPHYSDTIELRVMLSYQNKHFKKEEIEKFFNSQYLVSSEISRMGYKLKGAKIKCEIQGIISEAIAYGSIQIPQNGEPIILLKDRQTIGGYPKIGVVLDIDCFRLSQASPDTKVRFKEISIKEATQISKNFYNSFFNF